MVEFANSDWRPPTHARVEKHPSVESHVKMWRIVAPVVALVAILDSLRGADVDSSSSPSAVHWAFKELPPAAIGANVEQGSGDENPIDRFITAKMQLRAAEVGDLSKESKFTLERYGVNNANKVKAGFSRNCVLARRLVERGVRFVQLFNGAYAMGECVGNWDGRKTPKTQYDLHRQILDQPCAALLQDMKARGMFKDTLIAFVTEFGRMPTFQKGASGRDHNPQGFTGWLTGAGVKRGFSYGATDEFGHQAVQNVAAIYDLHATILHLPGLNHERLSYYHNGIERRLTDVHGEVLTGILA